MSDLTAANCGCNNGCNNGCGTSLNNLFGNSCNWIWIILLFSCFGGGNTSLFNNGGCGCNNENNSCEWLIWILLISCLCGNNNSCCG
ncbi:MAG: chorion class high-cysteine HCB protein 13 [Lachnospiraceae bacterium]|nr:chorion class high-cysteine HCB protein 13 [Lachnospiraceae bacterium]MBD5498321.1 chorion class high-cysteine HCB protein 13 [Lachnospiraceae bacterium]